MNIFFILFMSTLDPDLEPLVHIDDGDSFDPENDHSFFDLKKLEEKFQFDSVAIEYLDFVEKVVRSKKKLKQQRLHVYLGVDCEYIKNLYLSLQVSAEFQIAGKEHSFSFVVFNKKYQTYVQPQLVVPDDVNVFYDNFHDYESLGLKYFFKIFSELLSISTIDYKFDFLFYFSPKDFNAFFGFEVLKPFFKKNTFHYRNNIVQRRSLLGSFSLHYPFNGRVVKTRFFLKDFFGLEGGGLKTLIESCGIQEESATKDLLNQYKSNMDIALITYPTEFFKYALNDASVLLKLAKIKLESSNSILTDIFQVDDHKTLFTKWTFLFTMGRLVF